MLNGMRVGVNFVEKFNSFYETILFSLFDRATSSNQFLYLQTAMFELWMERQGKQRFENLEI